MKKLLLLTTGGTIASVETENGLAPAATPQELLSYIPQADTFCEVDVRQFFNIDSTNIQPEHWTRIALEIETSFTDYDGFVITHGTDTMAYTAAALSYLVQNAPKPIVLTGSQKPMSAPVTDAKKNLLDSLRFAVQNDVHGVYVVFDGKAIVGTRARKVRTKSYSAFESINYPIAAFIDGSQVFRYVGCEEADPKVCFYHTLVPRVFPLKLMPGITPAILRYIGEHYDAIVIEGYGVGGLPFQGDQNFLDALETLTRKGKLVVLATQVMLEGSDVEIYEVGVRAVRRYNVLQTYDMTVEAAAVKLMWIMAQTQDFAEICHLFYRCVHHDILRKPTQLPN